MHSKRLLNAALLLSFFTIGYNIIEGVISLYFGAHGSALTLLGFGTDSFVEVISGMGIAHMILRLKREDDSNNAHDSFERTALKITGAGFYLLTIGLMIGAIYKIITRQAPTTTFAGLIIAAVSIIAMYLLMYFKFNVGHQLNSDAIIADANCTKTCF